MNEIHGLGLHSLGQFVPCGVLLPMQFWLQTLWEPLAHLGNVEIHLSARPCCELACLIGLKFELQVVDDWVWQTEGYGHDGLFLACCDVALVSAMMVPIQVKLSRLGLSQDSFSVITVQP